MQALQSSSISSSPKSATASLPGSRPSSGSSSPAGDNVPKLTAEHLKLRLRLLPLLQVEDSLIRKLTLAGTTSPEATRLAQISADPDANYREKEVAVNSHFVWRGMFSRMMGTRRDSLDEPAVEHDDFGVRGARFDVCCWLTRLAGPREDPQSLPGGHDHAVGRPHHTRRAGLPEAPSAGHARLVRAPPLPLRISDPRVQLPGLPRPRRIAALRPDRRYAALHTHGPHSQMRPPDDILRARLKTLGVSEYRFQVKDSTRPAPRCARARPLTRTQA